MNDRTPEDVRRQAEQEKSQNQRPDPYTHTWPAPLREAYEAEWFKNKQ